MEAAGALLRGSWGRVRSLVVGELGGRLGPRSGGRVEARLERLLDYAVLGGKLGRGSLCLAASLALRPGLAEAEEGRRRAEGLAWAVELLQAAYLVADDVMDGAEERRGKAAWWRLEDVGLAAVNDAFLLDQAVDVVLRHHLCPQTPHPAYLPARHCLDATRQATLLGQLLDMEPRSLDEATPELYADIVRLKTSTYTFLCPLRLAMILSSEGGAGTESAAAAEVQEVGLALGALFQAQDDMLEVAGEAGAAGKTPRDVAEGKVTWALVEALGEGRRALPVLRAHYGRPCPDSRDAVLRLYRQLDLVRRFRQHEALSAAHIRGLLDGLALAPLAPLLHQLLDSLLGRSL